jgi:hypothetical protein
MVFKAFQMCDFVFFHSMTVRPNARGHFRVFTPSLTDTTSEPDATFKTYLPQIERQAKILGGQ